MTRPLRLEFAGALYHLTARGNARADIFLDDEDRRLFLDLLGKEVKQQGWRCYAYCLMSNHYHLLIETPQPNLVRGMRRLNGVYTQAFNRRHERVGHVFQGRYKSILVDRDAYLLVLSRYVVLNPVGARITRKPDTYPWSSYRATVGDAAPPPWLDTKGLLGHFGSTVASARNAYRRFVLEGIGAEPPWVHLRGQIWLGDDKFLKRMQGLTKGPARTGIPRAHAQPARPKPEAVLDEVAKVFGVSAENVLDRSNQEAFQTAVYLLRRSANLSLGEVAALSGVSGSRVSQIQRAIEQGEGPASGKVERLLKKYSSAI